MEVRLDLVMLIIDRTVRSEEKRQNVWAVGSGQPGMEVWALELRARGSERRASKRAVGRD